MAHEAPTVLGCSMYATIPSTLEINQPCGFVLIRTPSIHPGSANAINFVGTFLLLSSIMPYVREKDAVLTIFIISTVLYLRVCT